MRRRPASLEEARCATEKRARAHGEYAARSCRLPPDPGEHFSVLHQGFLSEAARHMQYIERRSIGQGRIRRQSQSFQIANRCGRLAVDAIGRVRDARQYLEWS